MGCHKMLSTNSRDRQANCHRQAHTQVLMGMHDLLSKFDLSRMSKRNYESNSCPFTNQCGDVTHMPVGCYCCAAYFVTPPPDIAICSLLLPNQAHRRTALCFCCPHGREGRGSRSLPRTPPSSMTATGTHRMTFRCGRGLAAFGHA
jgi:hypothetical protein